MAGRPARKPVKMGPERKVTKRSIDLLALFLRDRVFYGRLAKKYVKKGLELRFAKRSIGLLGLY